MNKLTALPFAFLFVSVFSDGVVSFGGSFAAQQMEIRRSEQYDQDQFEKSKPAIGTLAPDIKLKTLDGKAVSLSSYRGKNIVVIKAGYT